MEQGFLKKIYGSLNKWWNKFGGGMVAPLILFVVQFGLVVYFNLIDIRVSLDSDFANTIYHFREVIKNGTLNLPNWNHTTTMELDAVFLFALPLYYLVHDIFLAVGISNIIYALLYIIVIVGIFREINIGKTYILYTLCLLLTPYSFGMLEYFNMMFFGGACYSLKTLIPLLFIWLCLLCMKKCTERKQKLLNAVVWCGYLLFLFVTALSTGLYVMLCGIFPLICYMLFDIWKTGSWKGKYNYKHILLVIGSILVFAVGLLLHNKMYGLVSRNAMGLTQIENYAINFRACIRGIFDVFGATLYEYVKALSVQGIWYCVKMALTAFLVIAWIYNLVLICKKKEINTARGLLAMLPLFNFLILLVADSRYSTNTHIEYRYYLIGAIPLVLLLGIQMDEWAGKFNRFQKNIFLLLVNIFIIILMIGNNKNVMERWDRTAYAVELCDYFNTLDIESVFFVNDPDTAHICKGIDENHKYGAFISETQTLELSICSYIDSASGRFYGNRNALAVLVNSVPEDYMPVEIAQRYTKVGTVRWYDIYVSDYVYFP